MRISYWSSDVCSSDLTIGCSDINSFFSGSNSQPLPFASRYLIMHFQEHRSCRLGPPREHAGVSLGVDLSTQVGTNNGKGPEASRPQHVAGRNVVIV